MLWPFKKKQDCTAKNSNELTELGKKYKFRVSTPYGYYVEDVDKVVLKLENNLDTIIEENKRLVKQNEELEIKNKDLKSALSKLKLDITLMEIPDVSAQEDFHMLSKLKEINEEVGEANIKLVQEDPPTFVSQFEVISDEQAIEKVEKKSVGKQILSGIEVIGDEEE